MDLAKFLDLLRTRKFYLRRADLFADKLEGALPPGHRQLLDAVSRVTTRIPDANAYQRRARMGTFASCWTIGAHDNMALWQLYGGASTSIAITTTTAQLAKCVSSWGERVVIKKIEYVNHRKRFEAAIGRYTDPLEFKNIAYAFEKEARLMVSRHLQGWENNPQELRLPISDLNALIRSVVVAPEAQPWFYWLAFFGSLAVVWAL
ncbi:MAG: hypothetical protein HC794_02730 [Nitrospiraceae bacterium]|nr:hypothetical protein [Nitrospiraceae bacterium]